MSCGRWHFIGYQILGLCDRKTTFLLLGLLNKRLWNSLWHFLLGLLISLPRKRVLVTETCKCGWGRCWGGVLALRGSPSARAPPREAQAEMLNLMFGLLTIFLMNWFLQFINIPHFHFCIHICLNWLLIGCLITENSWQLPCWTFYAWRRVGTATHLLLTTKDLFITLWFILGMLICLSGLYFPSQLKCWDLGDYGSGNPSHFTPEAEKAVLAGKVWIQFQFYFF